MVLTKIQEYYNGFIDFYYDAFDASNVDEADDLKCLDNYVFTTIGLKAQQVDIILGDIPEFVIGMVIEHSGIKAL